jgi:hypothetical protein
MENWFTSVVIIIFVGLSCASHPTENKNMSNVLEQQSEQAVIAYLKLSDDKFGDAKERESILALGDKLEQIIQQRRVGEYDGHEFGEGYARLYMYGPDANKLFDAIIKTLKEHPSRRGSHIVKRFGSPGAKEERRDL